MGSDEMVQSRSKLGRMLNVACPKGRTKIIDDHLANMLNAISLVQHILAEDESSHFRHMLVLRDCGNLGFRQPAQANTVFKRNHRETIVRKTDSALR